MIEYELNNQYSMSNTRYKIKKKYWTNVGPQKCNKVLQLQEWWGSKRYNTHKCKQNDVFIHKVYQYKYPTGILII